MDKLYEKRQSADSKRQPQHKPLLGELHAALLALKPLHADPYSLTREDYVTLKDIPAYKAICLGIAGTVTSEYCYRLTTWPKLLLETPPPRQVTLLGPENKAFSYLMGEYDKTQNWLRLGKFLTGTYRGLRGFTWWTSSPMPVTPIWNTMCTAHSMGLFNDNVGTEALVLRCSSKYILSNSLCHVPSVVDAYFFNVFHATQDRECPACGRSISVERAPALELGAQEIVFRPVDIDAALLEVRPILLEDTEIHQVHFEDVHESLIEYYTFLAS